MDHFSGLTPTHPVIRAASEVEAVVKSVAGVEPAFMDTCDKQAALVALVQARDLVEGLFLRVLAVSDDVAEEIGARDVAGWLAPEARLDRAAVGGALRTARALAARWRLVETAVGEGRVNVAQAKVIVRCLDDVATGLAADADVSAARGEELLALAEAELVDLAGTHGPQELRRLGERILSLVAPGLGEERERKALEDAERRASAATSLRMRRRGDGSTDVVARIPDHVAARLRTYLDAYTSPRVDALAHGVIDPATGERLPGHRIAGEAFGSLLESLDPARLPIHGGGATTLVVTIDLATLMSGLGEATTGDGTRITAGQARRLACRAGLVPAVLGGDSKPLDVGRTRRLFTASQRTALTLRHRSCQAEGCDVPSTWCEAHHREPWSAGGRTDLDNAMLLCSWHHHRVHDPGFRTKLMPDGGVRFSRRT